MQSETQTRPLTHAELSQKAVRWLRNTVGCCQVLTEAQSSTGERPDLIAFWNHGGSVVVDVKTSVADAKADQHKPFRIDPRTGMGGGRWVFAERGVLEPFHVPEGWGLAEYDPATGQVLETQRTEPFWKLNHRAEKEVLLRALKAAERAAGQSAQSVRETKQRGIAHRTEDAAETLAMQNPGTPVHLLSYEVACVLNRPQKEVLNELRRAFRSGQTRKLCGVGSTKEVYARNYCHLCGADLREIPGGAGNVMHDGKPWCGCPVEGMEQ